MRKSAALKAGNEDAPTTENRTVEFSPSDGSASVPRRQYLTEGEVEQLCEAARRRGRYGYRDATMILMAYRHGLRVSELVALRWDQVDLAAGRIQVVRRKGSDDSVQPLSGIEIRALRRIKREQPAGLRHVFVSERGAPLTTNGFFKMLSRTAASIDMDDVHPHLLRHGTGFKLVNDGVDTRTIAACKKLPCSCIAPPSIPPDPPILPDARTQNPTYFSVSLEIIATRLGRNHREPA